MTTQTRPPATRGYEPRGSIKLTGRGAVFALFVACFLSQLLAAETGWSALADGVFVIGCDVVAYYTKPAGLLTVAICPPLVFFATCVCAQALTSTDRFSTEVGIVVTLGTSAPWLFVGTALAVVIALCRGLLPQARSMLGSSRVRKLFSDRQR